MPIRTLGGRLTRRAHSATVIIEVEGRDADRTRETGPIHETVHKDLRHDHSVFGPCRMRGRGRIVLARNAPNPVGDAVC
jgi:hypothetical protein